MDIVERLRALSEIYPTFTEAADAIEQRDRDNDLACAINEELSEKYNSARAEINRLQEEVARLQKRLAANSPWQSGL